MKLWSIRGNSQKLDGGAMFGNAPKAVWEKWSPADDLNRIELACRALLASPLGGKTVLFETGIGAFFEPKLRERYGVQEPRHVLIDSLREAGRLDNTLIVFVSDNGYAWGEHRLQGKNTPYDVSVRVPLVMRLDGVLPAGTEDPRIVAANVDVHATILDDAGVKPGRIDGHSASSCSNTGTLTL